MKKLKLGFIGSSGRMGAEARALLAIPPFSLKFSEVLWHTRSQPLDHLFAADVWVEFSSPEAVLGLCRESGKRGSEIPLVVGTTGWTSGQLLELESFAVRMAILKSANFAVGVQVCRDTLRFWSGMSELSEWKVSIRELHHTHKKDAPSGTALSLADTIRGASSKSVPIDSVRQGEVFGIHEVVYESGNEKISLIHEAKSRAVFAEGALDAALRLSVGHEAGSLPRRLLSLDDLYLRRMA